MRSLLALLAIALLGGCLAACGGSGKGSATDASASGPKTTPVSTVPTDTAPAAVKTKADADKDNDNDIGGAEDDADNGSVIDFGHPASSAEKRAIVALIKRYYAAAYAENGAAACSMIYSTFQESVPEDYGQSPPGQPYMRGTTCAAVVTLLFKHFHPQIAIEYPKLEVAAVRLIEHHGLVLLRFGALPERQILVAREGHIWRVASLLDSEVP